jgi:hypothetical protein
MNCGRGKSYTYLVWVCVNKIYLDILDQAIAVTFGYSRLPWPHLFVKSTSREAVSRGISVKSLNMSGYEPPLLRKCYLHGNALVQRALNIETCITVPRLNPITAINRRHKTRHHILLWKPKDVESVRKLRPFQILDTESRRPSTFLVIIS